MKDWKYILYVVGAIGLFVTIKLIAPRQYDWTVTFHHADKNPYGAYVLNELLPEIFNDNRPQHSFETLYEIKDSLKREGNLLIIASTFQCDELDTKALLSFVERGGIAFISAQNFYGDLSDTLGLQTSDYYFLDKEWAGKNDTTHLKFVNPSLDTLKSYAFKKDNIYNFFSSFDTVRTTVIARNDRQRPVAIRIRWGKGDLILNSTPMIFTNIYLIAGDTHDFASIMLSYLPPGPVQWTEYYQLGRMEIQTPLRFVLKTEPLRWAYYIIILSLLLFVLFEMKRRQRVIPVITPLQNTTLQFVTTIGNLYYQNKEHRSVAEKKILFLLEQIRTRYNISTTKTDKAFVELLAQKSGRSIGDVTELVNVINQIRSQKTIPVEELINLNEHIEKFNQ